MGGVGGRGEGFGVVCEGLMSSSAARFSASLSTKDRSSVGFAGVGGVCVDAGAGGEGGTAVAGLVGATCGAAVAVGAVAVGAVASSGNTLGTCTFDFLGCSAASTPLAATTSEASAPVAPVAIVTTCASP